MLSNLGYRSNVFNKRTSLLCTVGLLAIGLTSTALATFPPVIDLVTDTDELHDTPVVTVDGVWAVTKPLGDLDGDGLGDRLIEIPESTGDACPGVAILYSSAGVDFSFSRTDLDNLFRIVDREIIDVSGRSGCEYRNVRGFTEPRRIGDINGDGLIDFSINVSGIFDNVPRVVLGSTAWSTRINLNELDGSNGFAVVGGGHIIFPVGDLNGDGIDDIGHATGHGDNKGVIAGTTSYGSLLDVSTASSEQRLIGPARLSSLRGLGDIDGDGFDDLVAFPAGLEPFAENQIPRFVYGAADLFLPTLTTPGARVSRALEECGTRQCQIVPVGDIDSDGRDDVLASQRFEEFNKPPRSILYGREGGLAVRNAIVDYPSGESTRLVQAGFGFIGDRGDFYRGGFNDSYRIETGHRLDLDGDGVEDLLFSQNISYDRPGVYALFGTPGERPAVRSLADSDGYLGVAFDLGTSASLPEVGDLNLDGIDDFRWTHRRQVPFVPGRSRGIDGVDVLGLAVRRAPEELTLFWRSVDGANSYRVSIDDRHIDEVNADTTTLIIPDTSAGAELTVRVETLDNAGIVLSTQVRRVPAVEPFVDSFSINVYGKDLLELFINPLVDSFGRAQVTSMLVLRDGRVIGRTRGGSFTDAGVSPGQTYRYQLLHDALPAEAMFEVSDASLQNGPRLQVVTAAVLATTPSDPNVTVIDDGTGATPVIDDSPAAAANLRVVRYSPADAELMWDRADEPSLQYEVYRDGELISIQFGISYYDSRRPLNSGSIYEVITLRSDGTRSESHSVTLAALDAGDSPFDGADGADGADGEAPDVTEDLEPPANLRVVRYSNKDAELFWDRAAEPRLQYEVYRDGGLLRTGFAISFFDRLLTPDAGARYDVVAIRDNGDRSATRSVVLPPTGAFMSAETPAPQDVRIEVYSSTAAELFWTRAADAANIVRTEVTRDGILLGDTPGNSFFDNTRLTGSEHTYTLVAIDELGSRSEPVIIEM